MSWACPGPAQVLIGGLNTETWSRLAVKRDSPKPEAFPSARLLFEEGRVTGAENRLDWPDSTYSPLGSRNGPLQGASEPLVGTGAESLLLSLSDLWKFLELSKNTVHDKQGRDSTDIISKREQTVLQVICHSPGQSWHLRIGLANLPRRRRRITSLPPRCPPPQHPRLHPPTMLQMPNQTTSTMPVPARGGGLLLRLKLPLVVTTTSTRRKN